MISTRRSGTDGERFDRVPYRNGQRRLHVPAVVEGDHDAGSLGDHRALRLRGGDVAHGKPLVTDFCRLRSSRSDGEGGIRTHETLTGLPVFETGSFSHSDTSPKAGG